MKSPGALENEIYSMALAAPKGMENHMCNWDIFTNRQRDNYRVDRAVLDEA